MKKTDYDWSFIAIGIILFIYLIFALNIEPFYSYPGGLTVWDNFGYYLYMPAYFIYHDLSYMHFLPEVLKTYRPSPDIYQVYKMWDGKYLDVYPVGMAILYSPFFFLGHIWATLTQQPLDGFSRPYQAAILIGNFFYCIIALLLLRKVLKKYFSDKVVALTLLIVCLGTNASLYLTNTFLSHGQGFFLGVIVLYATIQWHEKHKWYWAFLIGLGVGLAACTRVPEILIGIIPLLWNVKDAEDFRAKLRMFASRWTQVLFMIVAFFIAILPQLIYTHHVTGKYFYDTYFYPGQVFDWTSPHFYNCLFSFRDGLMIYTPIMILFFTGFYFLFKNFRMIFWSCLIYMLLIFYVYFSWHIWWYGGSYSQRELVPSFAVLTIPLASFLSHRFSPRLKAFFSVFIVFCILLNIYDSYMVVKGHFDLGNTTPQEYKNILFYYLK